MTGDKSFQYSSYEKMNEYIIFVVSICQLNIYIRVTNKELRYFRYTAEHISYDYEF